MMLAARGEKAGRGSPALEARQNDGQDGQDGLDGLALRHARIQQTQLYWGEPTNRSLDSHGPVATAPPHSPPS